MAGGSSVTGLLLSYIGQVPLHVWILLLLLVLIVVGILLYWSYPKFISKWQKRHTLKYWENLKEILIEYHQGNCDLKRKLDLEKKYKSVKGNLNNTVSAYHLEIQSYLNQKHQNAGTRTGDIIFGNFKKCFSPATLSVWSQTVRRSIPDELDCFDELAREIVNLVSEK
jgi:hypothetical protein